MIWRGRKFARLFGKSIVSLLTTSSWLTLFAACSCPGHAVDQPSCINDDCSLSDTAGDSRAAWQLRVEEAKRRAREDARLRREHPELYVPIFEDPEIAASRRVLTDDSLQPGDIVSTKQGMFVYRGRSDQPPHEGDFAPIAPRPGSRP